MLQPSEHSPARTSPGGSDPAETMLSRLYRTGYETWPPVSLKRPRVCQAGSNAGARAGQSRMISLPPQAHDPTLAPSARRMHAGNHARCSRGLLKTLQPLGKLAAHGSGGARAHGASVAHRAPAANAERPKLRTHKQSHTRHITQHHTTHARTRPQGLARCRTGARRSTRRGRRQVDLSSRALI